mgnify:CR=1 FL=1
MLPTSTSLQSNGLRPDGHRLKLHPLEVNGRHARLQRILYPIMLAIYAALPWIHVGGKPAVWLDLTQRRFFLMGMAFNASDTYLMFFLLSGLGFLLLVLSAMWGRLWCGWACPQTVLLEGVFRRIEILVDGPARQRKQRERGAWTLDRVLRLGVKHGLFLAAALVFTHLFIAYFASMDDVVEMVQRPPSENLPVFTWMVVITGVLYFNFAWFREQLCLVVCPYGRLQSALADEDTISVGYDTRRGEPRGRKGTTGAADCVDCSLCVQACPTGIDIRNGLQLDCIGCAHCIDACNDVMVQIGRPPGLIRCDSLNGLGGKPRRFWRPRVYGYIAAAVLGVVALSIGINAREPLQVSLLRAQGVPREVTPDGVLHRLMVHVTSKSPDPLNVELSVETSPAVRAVVPITAMQLAGFEGRHIPFVIVVPRGTPPGEVRVTVTAKDRGMRLERRIAL